MRPLSGGGGVDSDSAGRAPACDRQLETAGAPHVEHAEVGLVTFRAAWVHAPETPLPAKMPRRRGGHVQDSVVRGASAVPTAVAGRRPDREPTTVATSLPPAATSTHRPRAGVWVESWSSQDRAYKSENRARS